MNLYYTLRDVVSKNPAGGLGVNNERPQFYSPLMNNLQQQKSSYVMKGAVSPVSPPFRGYITVLLISTEDDKMLSKLNLLGT